MGEAAADLESVDGESHVPDAAALSETPDDLDDGLLVIDLINKDGGNITTLAYDLKTKEFRQEQEEEEVTPRKEDRRDASTRRRP